jgi:ubiquinone/menaquinone biosynthesis C-methylase UbiE
MNFLPLGILLNRAALFVRRVQLVLNLSIPALLSPEALVRFNRWSYRRRHAKWAVEMPKAGLFPWEKEIVESCGVPSGGRVLVLFCGGGRDAVGLAKLGYHVSAVDFVPEFVEVARRNAREAGVEVEFSVQDSSRVEFPAESFDAAVAFLFMYSSVPGRPRRVEMLRRLRSTLKPRGTALLTFANSRLPANEVRLHRFLRRVARVVGNREYRLGDTIHANVEYAHYFQDDRDVVSEAVEAGFEDAELEVGWPGGALAVLRKKTPFDDL